MSDNWQLKAVLSAVDRMSPVLKGVNLHAKTTRKYLSDIGSAANSLTSKVGLPLTALSGIVGGFSGVAIKNAVVGFASMSDEAYKMSLRTGMSVEQWQRMKYVADQAAVPVESLGMGMGRLNKLIGDSVSGKNKNLASLFKHLRVSTRDANGELRSAVDMLPQLSDAFVRNKNPVVQARMGMALFGKGWQEMIPLLMQGSEGIEESEKRMKRFKGVMSKDDVNGGRELSRMFKDLDLVMKGFQSTIAKELVPVLKPVIKDVIDWAAANKQLVAKGVKEFVQDLVAWAKQVDWKGLIQGAKDTAKWIGKVVDGLGGARKVIPALVLIMNAGLISAVLGFAGSIGRLVFGLGGLVLKATGPIAPLKSLADSISRTNTNAGQLLGTVGKLGAALGVAGAAYAGWKAGGWLNDNAITPMVSKLSGRDNSLGTAIYGWTHHKREAEATAPTRIWGRQDYAQWANPGQRPSLVGAPNRGNASGKIEVSFKDAPPGMRVEQSRVNSDFDINTSVGYRSSALGMP